VELGFDLRASYLLGRHSVTSETEFFPSRLYVLHDLFGASYTFFPSN
jgi:hypothetical protein